MLDRYLVKQNNAYTFYKLSDLPTDTAELMEGNTFLSDTTDTDFTRGNSYKRTADAWVRIETDKDPIIDDALYPTLSTVLDYINNHFYVKQECNYRYNYNYSCCQCDYSKIYRKVHAYECDLTFSTDGQISGFDNTDDRFQVGDLIHIKDSKRNKNKLGYVTAATDNSITLDITLKAEETYGLLVLCEPYWQVLRVMAKMIWFDVYERDVLQSGKVTAESEGSYSVSYELDGATINGLAYPSGITNGLNPYINIRVFN